MKRKLFSCLDFDLGFEMQHFQMMSKIVLQVFHQPVANWPEYVLYPYIGSNDETNLLISKANLS